MKKILFFLILGIANLIFGGFFRLPIAVIFAFACIAAFLVFCLDELSKNEETKKQKQKR